MDASWGMTFLLFFECWISQKWKWMEKTSWNQTLGGKHLVVEWILSLAEYVNYPLPTVPTKTSRFAEYICSLPVLIFELSCPTGYLRVKHFLLCQAGFLSHFSYATLEQTMGLTECQADFLDCHGTMHAQSYHAPLSLLWHGTGVRCWDRNAWVESCRIFSPKLT